VDYKNKEMTTGEIIYEAGLTRRLKIGDLPLTPWLLNTSGKLMIGDKLISMVVMSERGPINLPKIDDIVLSNDYLEVIPELSVLLPRLVPNIKKLDASIKEENSIYLDELKKSTLPNVFGVVYNQKFSHDYQFLFELIELQPSFIVIRHSQISNSSPRQFIPWIIDLRSKIPPNIGIYLSGEIPIGFFALAFGLGIDIIDDYAAYSNAFRGNVFEDGFVKQSSRSTSELIKLNLAEINRDFLGSCLSIDDNLLWSRIHRDMHVFSNVASFVYLLGRTFNSIINYDLYPSNNTNNLIFTGDESLYHPDVTKYRKRVISRYVLPPVKKLIVLLPCSAKKPYAESKSHRMYRKAIRQGAGKHFPQVSVWSLTSPLGVVPQELETIYPVKYYDIPVTGHWSEEETQITSQMLIDMIEQLPLDIKILVHVSEGYRGMIEAANINNRITINWIGNEDKSDDALIKLTNSVEKIITEFDTPGKVDKEKIRENKEIIQAIVKYNHGSKCFLSLDTIKFMGRPPRPIQIQKDGQHFLTWDSLYGKVNLGLNACLDIIESSLNWVICDTDDIKGTSLFAIGIVNASETISPGDEVIIYNSTKQLMLAVGTALISGISMNQVNYGIAVKIKKKNKW